MNFEFAVVALDGKIGMVARIETSACINFASQWHTSVKYYLKAAAVMPSVAMIDKWKRSEG